MKTEYLKNYINLKECSKAAYNSYVQRVNGFFKSLQQSHNLIACIKFQSELHALKDHRELKVKDKQPIFKYFVERNVKDFLFLRDSNSIELRLIKLTKTHLEDYQLNWQELWERLLEKEPEVPTLRLYNQLIDFLRSIRHLYAPDNAVAVLDYFMERHSLYSDNLCLYISLFVNITRKTSKEILSTYLSRLLELYHLNQLKASDLLVMYINAAKYKQNEVSESVHTQLSRIVLYSLSTPTSEKKDSIEPKFSTQTTNIVFRIIGKCNTNSACLLQQIFQLMKNFIRPFEDSKKPLKFLCLLLMGLTKRTEAENNYREKIKKLKVKEQKRLKSEHKLQPSLQSINSQQQQSALTVPQSPLTVLSAQLKEGKQKLSEKKEEKKEGEKEKQKQEEEQSDDDDEQQNDSDEEDQDNKVEKMIAMDLEIQESVPDRPRCIQARIQKLQSLLTNEITPEIISVVKDFLNSHLQSIFYVNSKKMVSRILKEAFKLFPELIPRSLEVLEKAGSIPTINEEGLISNIKHIAKYLFAKELIEQNSFLENIMKLLARVKENRRMTDVWDIINTFIQKIPLLDEEDMAKIPESEKERFQKKYGQNHDRFYQTYSQQVFECVKRLFSESQYYDSNASTSTDKHILDLIGNSYPFFRRRVLRQMEEQILQNNNKFLLSIFHSGIRPSKGFEQSLREMIQNGNIESEQNMALDISVNAILSIDMDITLIKKNIRRYGRKNNFKFLKQCMVSLTNYNINYQPLSSSLEYLEKKPVFALSQEPPFQLVQDKMLHVYNYAYELVDQLDEELREFEEQPLRRLAYAELITQIYTSKDSTFKNMKVQKRKTINELLEILRTIADHLFHELQEYNPTTNTIDFKTSPYNRKSLLESEKFLKIVDVLTYNEIFLHDPNIMHNLSALLQNQIFFMYRHQIRLEKQLLKKYTKKNSRQELTGESNLSYTSNIIITKARIAHFSILLNRYKDTICIERVSEQLRVLLMAPGNEKSNTINKVLIKKTKYIEKEADHVIFLLSLSLDSRFYYEKIFSLLADFLTTGYRFTSQQIISVINGHLPLIQSQNIKIKQHSLKSLERFLKTMHKTDILGVVERRLRELIKRDKLELIWIISVLIVLKEGRRQTSKEEYLANIHEYLGELEGLIVHETRIVRRIALFAYSFCFRRAKQAMKVYERLACSSQKYSKPKTVPELFETGYLREEHIGMKQIAGKQTMKKLAPYTTYRIKKYLQLQIYKQIEEQAFGFMLRNPQLGMRIIKQFHTDMAASVEQVLSMLHNKKHDLGQIAVRSLEGCYIYTKLQNLHFDRFEHHFGEYFFRYLFAKDAKKNSFKFFAATHLQIEQMLTNLQAYDNQTFVFIYLMDVIIAYQDYNELLEEDMRVQVQKFVERVVEEMLYKGSGTIFKHLTLLLNRCKGRVALDFIIKYFQNLIKSKEKVSRVSQLLFTLCEDDYPLYISTTEFIMSERVEISHAYINTLLNTIITLPEKYMLTQKHIQHFGVIDLAEELAKKRVQKLYNEYIFLPSTGGFNEQLKKNVKNYLEIIRQPVSESEEAVKEKNQLIKATYSIVTNAISAYCQFYETEESVNAIIELLELLFKLFEYKMDLPVDYKQLEEMVKNLLSNKHDHIANFEAVLGALIVHMPKLPLKKQADIIKIISNRPGNFLFVGKEYYQRFIARLLQFEQFSMVYKDLLLSLSTLMAYVPLPLNEVDKLLGVVGKGQGLLLMQAYVMASQDIGSPFVDKILAGCTRQRRNLFCKEMLHLRGKKEYLDDEESYLQWKKIKQYSNPYHYHA